MRKLSVILVSLIFSSALFLSTAILYSQGSLSELSKLKAENFKLKATLAQCNTNLSNFQLSNEKVQLELEFRKELNAKESDTFDWNSSSFTSSSKP